MIAPCRKTFSRPVRSGWNPAATSISAPARPRTSQRPRVGLRIRVSSLRIVDLPAPFGPMMPSASPGPHLEGDVVHRPELAARVSSWSVRRAGAEDPADRRRDQVAQAVVPLAAAELLPDAVEDDRRMRHLDVLRECEFGAVERAASSPAGRTTDSTAVARERRPGRAGGRRAAPRGRPR